MSILEAILIIVGLFVAVFICLSIMGLVFVIAAFIHIFIFASDEEFERASIRISLAPLPYEWLKKEGETEFKRIR